MVCFVDGLQKLLFPESRKLGERESFVRRNALEILVKKQSNSWCSV